MVLQWCLEVKVINCSCPKLFYKNYSPFICINLQMSVLKRKNQKVLDKPKIQENLPYTWGEWAVLTGLFTKKTVVSFCFKPQYFCLKHSFSSGTCFNTVTESLWLKKSPKTESTCYLVLPLQKLVLKYHIYSSFKYL